MTLPQDGERARRLVVYLRDGTVYMLYGDAATLTADYDNVTIENGCAFVRLHDTVGIRRSEIVRVGIEWKP